MVEINVSNFITIGLIALIFHAVLNFGLRLIGVKPPTQGQ